MPLTPRGNDGGGGGVPVYYSTSNSFMNDGPFIGSGFYSNTRRMAVTQGGQRIYISNDSHDIREIDNSLLDLNSAFQTGVSVDVRDVVANGGGGIQGHLSGQFVISSDGNSMVYCGSLVGGTIYQLSLATPFVPASAFFNIGSFFTLPGGITATGGLYYGNVNLANEEQTLMTVDATTGDISRFTLGTPGLIASAALNSTTPMPGAASPFNGTLFVNPNGLYTYYMVDGGIGAGKEVTRAGMRTPFDTTTILADNESLSVGGFIGSNNGTFSFTPDGANLFATDNVTRIFGFSTSYLIEG